MSVDRREFLKLGAVGTLGVAGLTVPLGAAVSTAGESLLAPANFPAQYRYPFVRPPVLKPYEWGFDEEGKFERYNLNQQLGTAEIVPGLRTKLSGYNGVFPGPIISVDQGTRVDLHMRNELTQSVLTHPGLTPPGRTIRTSTHLHGSASLPQYDGYADDVASPSQYKSYKYPNWQSARTMWYHDHGVHYTGQQVYAGLASQYHVHDPLERAQLPQGEFDVPILLSDAAFDAAGQLAYNDNNTSGLWGDVILVNGVPWPLMTVKPRVYRFRIVVASIARSYNLQLSTQQALTIVGTDGGMMPAPQQVLNYRHAGAERYEVLIDFRGMAGRSVDLLNLSNPNNQEYLHTNKVMRFQVVDDGAPRDQYVIPTKLDRGAPTEPGEIDVMSLTPAMANNTVTTSLRVGHDDITNLWTINDKTWTDVQRSGYTEIIANPQRNDIRIWEVENRSGGWFHPVHIHLVDFQVIWRSNTVGNLPYPWERGPKDVVYLGERETVRLLMQFALGKGNDGGRYMVHCHNLPHEDHDMMSQFAVGNINLNHPILADPAKLDDLPVDEPRNSEALYEPGYPVGT